MENNTQLPVEVQKEINEQADKYGFVVPYDGSNKFYNDDKVEGYKAGATAYATKLQDAQKENADLKRWKQEAIHLLAPIIEYGQGHKDAQLGRSCTEFVLQRAKLYDTLKAQQGPRWVKASERLPEQKSEVVFRKKGVSRTAKPFYVNEYLFNLIVEGVLLIEYYIGCPLSEIEWLDESAAAGREETEGVKAMHDALTTIYGTMIDPQTARRDSAHMLNLANQAICKYEKERKEQQWGGRKMR